MSPGEVTVPGEAWTIKELFCYPNEQIYWSLLIVIYPFVSGLAVGAFILSTFYYVFGVQKLKDIARFSLVFSLALVAVAPLPLLLHLEQPTRCFFIVFTPHFTSAMSAFGFVYGSFVMLLCTKLWLVYRKYFVETALYLQSKKRKNFGEWISFLTYTFLTLGAYDISEEALRKDAKATKVVAIAGIPWAFFLTGYVGFLFGSVKANALWVTLLMPIIFIASAIVSGSALCVLTYLAIKRIRKILHTVGKGKADTASLLDDDSDAETTTIQITARFIFFALITAATIELLDLLCRGYIGLSSWEILQEVIYKRDLVSIFLLQYGIGNVIPVFLLLWPGMSARRLALTSLLILFGVLMMRWNVVMGGQSFSRTFAGYMDYVMPIIPRDLETLVNGLFAAVFIVFLPFVLLWIISWVLPLFPARHQA